ncbi:amicyanin [Streptomyces sp. cf386]|uniref:cupredoxin domain-containing protein n=1 Tax=Streptomyces sp. cf386 TaxID=1761904 RepID=UPI00087F2CDC|nr:cupredoxin family copper-binding protein [Streptomyces sp. cf386]SDM83850.1 amicyanin [Streptomyces sp. cf386]
MRAARRAVQGAVLALSALLGLLFVVPGGQASAATYRVTMSGYAYSPASLTIPVGSTVTWTNQDTAPHDVKTTSGPVAIHSPMLNKGGTWSFTFTTPGTYAYYCTVHPNMTARIVVQAAAPATSAAAPTHDHSQAGAASGNQSSGHHATVPSRTATTRAPASSPVRSTPSPSHQATANSATPSPTPTATASPTPQTQVIASTTRPLDPLLVLTGIVAGVAVMCLLLVGSRAARSREEEA